MTHHGGSASLLPPPHALLGFCLQSIYPPCRLLLKCMLTFKFFFFGLGGVPLAPHVCPRPCPGPWKIAGLPKDKLSRLLELGEIPEAECAKLYNLQYLGQSVENPKGGKGGKKSKRRTRPYEYDLSRWTPILKDIVEDATTGKLSLTDYPCVRGAPDISPTAGAGADEPVVSARSRGGWAGWKKKGTAGGGGGGGAKAAEPASSDSQGRVIVFIAGTLSYSEMRVAYEVSAERGWDVVVGSHAVAAPEAFMSKVGELSQPLSVPILPGADGGGGAGGAGAGEGRGGAAYAGPSQAGTLTFVKGSTMNTEGMQVAAL